MILSRGRRFIFVHIPKTGGTALALALEARAMKDDMLIGDTPKARARRGRLHGVSRRRGGCGSIRRWPIMAGLVPATTSLPTFFTLTLVRNPWDRVVSYYPLAARADLCPSGGGSGEGAGLFRLSEPSADTGQPAGLALWVLHARPRPG